ncbi:Zinc finger, CCHC-type, partial [Parasponia andersonii]
MCLCIKKGYWKKDCPKLQNKGKSKTTSDAYVAEVEDDESNFALVSQPMCPHKEWFFNFEELNDGFIYMGNDESCKTTRVSSIQLKNHNGSTKILADVQYVPKLKKNLISLGALESKGFAM